MLEKSKKQAIDINSICAYLNSHVEYCESHFTSLIQGIAGLEKNHHKLSLDYIHHKDRTQQHLQSLDASFGEILKMSMGFRYDMAVFEAKYGKL